MAERTNRGGLGLLAVRLSFSEASVWGAGHVRAGRPEPAFRVINGARRIPPPTRGHRGFCHLSSPLADPVRCLSGFMPHISREGVVWSLLPNPESCLLLVEETPLKSIRASLPDALEVVSAICGPVVLRPPEQQLERQSSPCYLQL